MAPDQNARSESELLEEGLEGEELVTIGRSELAALRATADRASREGPEREEIEARARADGERRAVEWERACKEAVRDRELATALAGRPLVTGASAQLIKLLREELDVFEQDGALRVTSRDGRTVDQAVADWLGRPEYAHFRSPASRGGATALGGSRGPVAVEAPPPRTLGEVVLTKWRDVMATGGDASSAIGLGRRRVGSGTGLTR